MKKVISIALCIAIIASLFTSSFTAEGKGKVYGDYKCVVMKNKTLKITKYKGNREYVTIPDKIDGKPVTAIGDKAFSYCSCFKGISLPKGLKTIGEYAFYGCSKLKEIIIPDSVRTIGGWSFSSCTSAEKLIIGKGVTTIGYNAFESCSNLTEISIESEKLENAESGIFSLTSFFDNQDNWDNGALYVGRYLVKINGDADENFRVKEGTIGLFNDSLNDYYLSQNKTVKTLYIPKSVKYIGECFSAMNFDYELETIFLDEENPFFSCQDGILFSTDMKKLVLAPLINNNTKSYTVPNGVETIGRGAFQFSLFKEVKLPDTLKTLCHRCFCNSSLKSIDIPKNVSYIGAQAFYNVKIEEVILPKKITKISGGAFEFTNLKHIKIPKNVKSIESSAFYGTPLESAELNEGLKTIASQAFRDCKNLKTLYVPKSVERIDKYFATPGLIVQGYRGSYAEERYLSAKKTGYVDFKFKAIDPKAPEKTIATGLKGKIKIRYKKVKNAGGFQVKLIFGNRKTVKTYKTKKPQTKEIKGLKAGTYKIKIRAFSLFKGKRVYGKWAKTKTVKVI